MGDRDVIGRIDIGRATPTPGVLVDGRPNLPPGVGTHQMSDGKPLPMAAERVGDVYVTTRVLNGLADVLLVPGDEITFVAGSALGHELVEASITFLDIVDGT